MRMLKKLRLPSAALALLSLLLAGCGEEEVDMMRFFLEAPERGLSDAFIDTVTLKNSGLTYTIQSKPALVETNIVNVELVRVNPGPKLALAFYLDNAGRRALYRMSISNRDASLIFNYKGQAIGARTLDGPIDDGILYMFVELPDNETAQLAVLLKENAERAQKQLRDTSML